MKKVSDIRCYVEDICRDRKTQDAIIRLLVECGSIEKDVESEEEKILSLIGKYFHNIDTSHVKRVQERGDTFLEIELPHCNTEWTLGVFKGIEDYIRIYDRTAYPQHEGDRPNTVRLRIRS